MDQLERIRQGLCGLCEATEDGQHEAAQGDGIEAAFARGRRHEAKSIRNAMCEVIREQRQAAVEVWLCLAISAPGEDGKPDEQTYAFSSMDEASKFCDADRGRAHVVYSRVLNHPEIAEAQTQ